MAEQSFGSVLRDHRRRAGLTQRQLATATGLSLAAIRDLEQGRSRHPRATSVAALAAALSMSESARTLLYELVSDAGERDGSLGGTQVSILGPLAVTRGGVVVAAGAEPRRALLAVLALAANRPVARADLIDVLWPGEPPAHAIKLLHTHVARLRRTLATDADPAPHVSSVPGGYRLDATPACLDVLEFRDRVTAAARTAATDPEAGIDAWERALALWRGEPLTNVELVADSPGIVALSAERIAAVVRYADLAIAVGTPQRALPVLRELAGRHPLHETLLARLIRATALTGDQAGALRSFERIRAGLAEELGVDPGGELRDLHRKLLRQEELGANPPTEPAHPRQPSWPVRLLPADTADFTGRTELVELVRNALADPRHVPPVIVVEGPGGTGKSTFAVHVAHLLRDGYPDGQLFVDLGGARPTPADPADALSRLLRALGDNDHTGLGLADLAARYRLLLEGRRVVVVLDDAAGAQQVRPFLTGQPGCAVLVATRARLTTLPGANRIELGVLNLTEATALLTTMIGADRVAAEPAAGVALVEACAGLPLALRIAGARLVARPHWRVATLVDRLSDERRRLDELTVDDLAVRASLAISYQGLDQDTRWCFRLLGFHDPPDFAPWTVAALLDAGTETADDLIDRLIEARLVDVLDAATANPRYRMHSLVRLYARELAIAHDANETLLAAVRRALGTTLRLVERLSEPVPYAVPGLTRHALADQPLPPGVTVPAAADRAKWLAAEETALIATVERAAALGLSDLACGLADGLVFASFALSNNFTGWGRAHSAALAVAHDTGNSAAEAVLRCGIGHLRYKQDRFADAVTQFATALDLFKRAGYFRGEAAALYGLGNAHRETGAHRQAIPVLEQAQQMLDRLGDREGTAHTCYGLGYCFRELGDDDKALELLHSAATLYQELGHQRGLAIALRGTGLVHRATGNLSDAEHYCAKAHQLAIELDDRLIQSYTAQALAKIWIRAGTPHRAHEPLTQGLRACHDHHDRFGVALIQRTIGELHLATGQFDDAVRDLRHAQTLWQEINHDLGRARTLRDLGAAHTQLGDHTTAHHTWRDALTTFTHLGTREAHELTAWRATWGCDCTTLT